MSNSVDLKAKYEARIAELQTELDAGNKLLQQLATQSENVRVQLLRIQGAQMVLREMLKDMEPKDVVSAKEAPEVVPATK